MRVRQGARPGDLRDGAETARRTITDGYRGNGRFSFGSSFAGWVPDYARVDMDEVRLWTVARSAAAVQARMRQRLTGGESGLAGYWPAYEPAALVNGRPGVEDRSAQGRHVVLTYPDNVTTALSPLEEKTDGYRIVASVGDRRMASRELFPPNEWTHLAAAYEQSWAVELAEGTHVEVADDDALDLIGDLTVEVFCRVDVLGAVQGLLSKGRAADGRQPPVPAARPARRAARVRLRGSPAASRGVTRRPRP
ncbi:hypothetical protein [Streptomyces formicae]|uniref:Uncharacterized protein n=1 Tax=Streptomyces formicae TaxID=1616117 RepID=A0A291QN03_9ACTN|nr:hypothetical protein [Streptomyces formicae]ATL32938.1 hypothetical protein KY5_7920c [Streptomyces formicae]